MIEPGLLNIELRLAALKFLPFLRFSVIFKAANIRDLVFTREWFSSWEFSNSFGRVRKNNGRCIGIINRRVYQVVPAMRMLLVSLFSHFPKKSCLSPRLSSWMVGFDKQKLSTATLHLLQNFLDIYVNIVKKLVTKSGGKQIYRWTS